MRIALIVFVLAGCGDDNATTPPQDLAAPHDFAAGPDLAPFECDPIAQNCPMGQKCTALFSTTGTPELHCAPVTGTLADGVRCADADAGASSDDCDKGLLCFGQPSGAFCRKFCTADAQCTLAGEFCGAPGWCVGGCTVLGSDCPTDFDCTGTFTDYTGAIDRPICRPLGTSTGSCNNTNDCAAGLVCATTHQCVPVCSPSHPCSGNKKCTQPNGATMGVQIGYCV